MAPLIFIDLDFQGRVVDFGRNDIMTFAFRRYIISETTREILSIRSVMFSDKLESYLLHLFTLQLTENSAVRRTRRPNDDHRTTKKKNPYTSARCKFITRNRVAKQTARFTYNGRVFLCTPTIITMRFDNAYALF